MTSTSAVPMQPFAACRINLRNGLVGACIAIGVGVAHAQSSIHEFGARERIDAGPAAPKPLIDPQSLAAPVTDVSKVVVRRFRYSGVRLIAPETLDAELAGYTHRELAATDLLQAAQAVAVVYLRKGWMARVRVSGVSVADGIADLVVSELHVGQVRVDLPENTRVGTDIIDRFIRDRLVAGAPLPFSDLESGVIALNAQPGIGAAIGLDPGEKPDEVDVTVRISDRPILSGRLSVDNHGLREIGQERLGLGLRADNALGLVERFNLEVEETAGSQILAPALSLPLGGDGTRIGIDSTHAIYRAKRAGAPLGLKGSYERWRVSIRQPLVRRAAYLLDADYAVLRTAYRDGSIVGELRRRRILGGRVGLLGLVKGASSLTRFTLDFERGSADLSGNESDFLTDAASAVIDGVYSRIRWRLAHQLPFADGALTLRASGQWANRNLDATSQFSLGGVSGVRAYPTVEVLGDAGWLGTVEWQRRIGGEFDGRLFIDTGSIRRNAKPWANQRNRYDLSGLGAGVVWRLPDKLSLSADVAYQIGGNPGRNADGTDSDGRQAPWRAWLSMKREF